MTTLIDSAGLATHSYVKQSCCVILQQMNQLTNHITWGLISLQGLLLLIDPEARNHIYNTFSAFNSVSIPFLQSFSENMRYIVSLILIPSVFYSRSTTIPKFASLVAYVFFICLHSNLIFYNKPTDVKFLLFQLLLLGKALYLLVDDMLEADRIARVSLLRKKSSIIAPASPTKISQQQFAQKRAEAAGDKKVEKVQEKKGKKAKSS